MVILRDIVSRIRGHKKEIMLVALGAVVTLGSCGIYNAVTRPTTGPAQLITQPRTQATQPTTQAARPTTQRAKDMYELSGRLEERKLPGYSTSELVIGDSTYMIKTIPEGWTACINGETIKRSNVIGYLVDTQNARTVITGEGTSIEPVGNPYALVNVIKEGGLMVENLKIGPQKTEMVLSIKNLERIVETGQHGITNATYIPTTSSLNTLTIGDGTFYRIPVNISPYALGDALNIALIALPAEQTIIQETIEGKTSTRLKITGEVFVPLRSRGLVPLPVETQPATQPAKEPELMGEFPGVLTTQPTQPTTSRKN